jgi:hypothetical protein
LDVHWPAATVALQAVSLFWFMQLLTVEVGAQREQDLKQEAKTLLPPCVTSHLPISAAASHVESSSVFTHDTGVGSWQPVHAFQQLANIHPALLEQSPFCAQVVHSASVAPLLTHTGSESQLKQDL